MTFVPILVPAFDIALSLWLYSVQGHVTSSGTYVQPYVATNPNSTQRDNYSATGNVNPYTGAVGTRNPRY